MKTIQSGWSVFKRNLKLIFSKPYLLIPMIIALLAPILAAIWFNATYNVETMEILELLLVLFAFTFISIFSIGVASLFILEIIEQLESRGKINPFKALFDMLSKDLWRALPIIILWSLIDFILYLLILLLDATRSRKNRPKRPRGPIQRAVEAFRDLIRMGSMMIFTVIAWEKLGPKESFDKGYRVFKYRFSELLVGWGLNKVMGIILAIPLILIFIALAANLLPLQTTLISVIIYTSIILSLRKLIEQLFVSELYLWYLHYERAKAKALSTGSEPPASMYDIKRPFFTDSNYDLVQEGDIL
jgi:hypothetical protein